VLVLQRNAKVLLIGGICFLLILVAGCSPVSENLVKKAQIPRSLVAANSSNSPMDQGVRAELPEPDRLIIKSYGRVVKRYSEEYGMDWRLVLAVMKVESGFARDAESDKGATGLMQIMPVTGSEVAKVLDVKDMAHPKNNIHGGVFYLRKLYNLFDGAEEQERIKLMLAAYNAGVGRIYDAQVLAAYLHNNPRKWEAVKEALPLLSKRYYTLHRSIWDQDRPKTAGWFGNSRETIAYVERVMDCYEDYKNLLN
jgi:membrane-bound lytic murein transglycosylase F